MKKYSLVIFDLDGTIINDTVYIWQTLHDYFNTDPVQRRQAHQDYLSGRINYAQWAGNDLVLLQDKRAGKKDISALFQTLSLVPNARDTLYSLKRKQYRLAIISGSVDLALYTALPEADTLFDDIFINKLCFDNNDLLENIVPTSFDMEHKAAGLHFLVNKYNVSTDEVVFVGDNENDIHIAREAGLSIAFNSKSRQLNEIASVVIPGNDLSKILDYIE